MIQIFNNIFYKILENNFVMEESHSYICSLQKPTVVQSAIVGRFRNDKELDLMLARVNRIDHLLLTAEGLKPHKEIPIFGRIATMNAFKLPGEKLDSIVVLTGKYDMAILAFEPDGTPRTRAFGHVSDKVGRQAETGIIACVHETGLIALRLYEGHLKLIQWQEGKELKNFNLRFEDNNVTDVAFLEATELPTVAYFYQDMNGRHLKVCEIDMDKREFRPPLWHQSNIEAEATLLVPIPAPYGGIVVVGQESISYQKSPTHFIAVAPPLINMARFNCYGRIDKTGERFLLGDMSGRLFMLLLLKENSKEGIEEIRDLKIEMLGEISIPECLVYLDNSVALVGSKLGDSQLIRLSTEPVDPDSNSFVIVIDTFPNLGPIRDLILIETEGQKQLISASGAYKDGSLRIIRSGIGIDEMATVDLSGIKAIFPLRIGSELDNYLVISFAGGTNVLLIDREEMEDTQIPDFDLSKTTLWAGNLSSNRIIQINSEFVQLISGDGNFNTKWTGSTREYGICLASVNPQSGQILVSSGHQIFYLSVIENEINLIHQLECKNEIACIDISPLGTSLISQLFAVGFWAEHAVAIYSLNSEKLEMVVEEKLLNFSEFLPKSLLLISMEEHNYLFIGLGDGTVVHFNVDPKEGILSEQKRFSLGTRPTSLCKFISRKGAVNVFACSDRPSVIYSSNQKISFSNVNLRTVTQMSPLNSDVYRDCLALSDGENMIIGIIDDIQKLHIRSVPLGESVSRIAYDAGMIAILTSRPEEIGGVNRSRPSISITGPKSSSQSAYSSTAFTSNPSASQQQQDMTVWSSYDGEVHSVCFLDANTYECLHVIELNKQEQGLSICSAKLGDDPNPYFAIGTTLMSEDSDESKQGRIIIIQANQNTDSSEGSTKLRIVTEKETKGAVYAITTLGNKLICTVNSTVRLYEWTPERDLRLECSNFSYIQAIYLKTKGDLVLVGDLMRSICLLSYKPMDSSFEEVGRDYSAEWTTAVEIICSEMFFAAESNYNIFCCSFDTNADTEEEKNRLKQVGLYYLGEMVNIFQRGTIINTQQREASRETIFTNPLIYGTSDGGLGTIVQVPSHIFTFLQDLQKAIATKTHNCMRVDHAAFRSFFSERRIEPASGFIDGDLIESIVEMPKDLIQNVLAGLKMKRGNNGEQEAGSVTTEDLLKLIEDLAQIH